MAGIATVERVRQASLPLARGSWRRSQGAIFSGAIVLFLIVASASEARGSWPLGGWGGRSLQRVELPGVTCGNGTPYAIFYSVATDPTDRRATIYLMGGGSTKCAVDDAICPSASVDTSMRNLSGLDKRLTVPATNNLHERVFMDHPDNDDFMGPGHWFVIPYCTQDMHLGGRSDVQTYDMTDVADFDPNNVLVAQVESQLNATETVASLEANYPGLEIAAVSGAPGAYQVDSLLVHVVHRGDANVQAALQWVFDRATNIAPDFFETAQLVVTGGSAGGLGALHQFWRFGDALDGYPEARLMLAPLAGGSIERWYSEDAGGLVYQPPLAAEIDRRWDFWQGQRPCEIAGGDHTPTAGDDCDDIVDLIEHYRLQRYPGRDIVYMPMVNKEDSVALGPIFGDELETVIGFARTIHRYFQNLSRVPTVHPYAIWTTYHQNGGAQQREHTPDRASILQVIQRPSGGLTPAPYSMLRYMNLLAARSLDDLTPQIEHVPVEIDDIDDPNSAISLETDRPSYPDGNVARPVGLVTRKMEFRDDVVPPLLLKKRSFKFTASTRRDALGDRVVVPAPGSGGDPTLHGARLAVLNTDGSGESSVLNLPASGWSMLGSPARPKGWKWRSRDAADGVSLITIKADHLSVKAGKDGFSFTLDEAQQGSLGMRLELGDDWIFCADAPARTSGSPPTSARYDLPGRFSGAKSAPAPAVCPLRPVP
jgi:hypothetical protein